MMLPRRRAVRSSFVLSISLRKGRDGGINSFNSTFELRRNKMFL